MKDPVIYELGHKYKVVTNIRGATIKEDIGLVTLEVVGDEDKIESLQNLLRAFGLMEVMRTGTIAMSRGMGRSHEANENNGSRPKPVIMDTGSV